MDTLPRYETRFITIPVTTTVNLPPVGHNHLEPETNRLDDTLRSDSLQTSSEAYLAGHKFRGILSTACEEYSPFEKADDPPDAEWNVICNSMRRPECLEETAGLLLERDHGRRNPRYYFTAYAACMSLCALGPPLNSYLWLWSGEDKIEVSYQTYIAINLHVYLFSMCVGVMLTLLYCVTVRERIPRRRVPSLLQECGFITFWSCLCAYTLGTWITLWLTWMVVHD